MNFITVYESQYPVASSTQKETILLLNEIKIDLTVCCHSNQVTTDCNEQVCLIVA